ncbi:unnamed protein product [Mytilus coruscus]|uniref:Uncharacterized protein n=1 Tax=Mytilus coruscus TaxID=42192 RepID=A0A6J8ECX1_MYTCO|nr:unnamed protein product [Mytilus coruscus]
MRELQATPNVEMYLLIKWLGPSPQQHISIITAANANNPEKALLRTWTKDTVVLKWSKQRYSTIYLTVDKATDILLLVERDISEAVHVLDQRTGQGNQQYGQKLHFGWTIGETCLGKTHTPLAINTYKTHLLGSGCLSILPPCSNEFKIHENIDNSSSLPIVMNEDEFEKKNRFHEDEG